MKRTFIALYLMVLFSFKLLAQGNPACMYSGNMAVSNARIKVDNYKKTYPGDDCKKSKSDILNGIVSSPQQPTLQHPLHISYKLNDFLNLVHIVSSIDSCTGIRVYFGALDTTGVTDKDDRDYALKSMYHLVPMIVPTYKDASTDVHLNINNNYTLCYFINPKTNSIKPLTKETTKAWKNYYNNYVRVGLNAELGRRSNGQGETKYIWYSIEELKYLYMYATCQVKDPSIVDFNIEFAAFDNPEQGSFRYYDNHNINLNVSNQLTIILEIPSLKNKMLDDQLNFLKKISTRNKIEIEKYFTLKAEYEQLNKLVPMSPITKKRMENIARKMLKILGGNLDGNFDTGLPCPPDTRCIDLVTTP